MTLRTTLLASAAVIWAGVALGQALDLSRGGPTEVTATDGIEWRQADQVVIAHGNAKAIRDGVTIDADRLMARYRPRGGAAAAPTTGESPASSSEIWRFEADGQVQISTATDRAAGDRAVYDIDQAVMVLTGRDLWLTTQDSRITARDSLEYWTPRRMAVARGAAVVTTQDGRRIQGDTIVGYFLEAAPEPPVRGARPAAARPGQPPAGQQAATLAGAPASGPPSVPGAGSKLDRVEAFGNIEIRTATEIVRGDRAVYSPVSGIARVLGNVRITRGENQLNGQEAIVDLTANTARLVSSPGARVQGLIVPNSEQPGADQPGGTRPRPGGRP
ncbi:LptA/OstA family protein [Humitalea sp. 24SJ18S-53]|uniref:LptA/OstA family protein n=1 Tax=Humitalea sp. 24SJ18S-53 TaxID=3422307 RepID=UPI003D670756